jgi:hypothetical protein
MEIPSKVSVFNRTLEVKGKAGTLVSINDGFFEVVMEVQSRNHTVLFPIAETVVIFNDAIPDLGGEFEIER